MSDGDAQKLVDAVADATRTGMGLMSTDLARQAFLGRRALPRHGAGQRRRLLLGRLAEQSPSSTSAAVAW